MRAAVYLRALGYDAVTAREKSNMGVEDFEDLLYASEDGRILVTHNRLHFRLLHGAWLRWTSYWNIDYFHGGIIIVEQRMNWDARRIGSESDHFIQTNPNLSNRMYQRGPNGWSLVAVPVRP